MRGHDLRKRRLEAAPEKVLIVLKVTYLAWYLEPLSVGRPPIIEQLDGLVSMTHLVKDKVCADSKSSPPLASLTVNRNHALRVLRQVKHCVEHQLENLLNGPWVVVHEWKVGQFDLSVRQGELFTIHEVVVAHVVNLYAAFVVGLEKLDHVVLAVSKQFVEALAWQPHRNHSTRDVAQVKVEAAVLVSISVPRDKSLNQ